MIGKNRTDYSFKHYISLDRWASFYYQLKTILECQPATMLEVGKGSGVLEQYIKNNTTIRYQSVDVEEKLMPDIVGSVTALPLGDNTFDLIAVFEVLEHLPFEDFDRALGELKRVTRQHVIISLPDSRPHIGFSFKAPLLPRIRLAVKIPFPRKHIKDGEHYFEVGKRGYSNRRITALMRKRFRLVGEFIPYENQYHHFYLLEKNV